MTVSSIRLAVTTIQNKRASSSVWSSKNPILLAGEIGIETDTGLMKAGDGEHNWNDLQYVMWGAINILAERLTELERITAELQEAKITPIREAHILTATEVTDQTIELEKAIKTGYEDRVIVFFSGVAQTAGADFTATGQSISWSDKGLSELGLMAGDTVLIHYMAN